MGTSAIGGMNIVLSANAANFSQAIAQAQAQLNRFARAGQQAGHSTVSSMQAASASIRLLEGGMSGNIRAAERFISTIPGVGKVLQAAFPLVGGIAFAGMLAKVGSGLAAVIQKGQNAPTAIANSFRELNLQGQTANDTLSVTNDRLENEIAKLEGKPQNNLQLALDQARVASDKMVESLDRANAKIKEVLSQNAVPWWVTIFTGKAGIDKVAADINGQNQNLASLAAQANVLQHQGDTAGADRIRASIESTRRAYLAANAKDIADRQANQALPGALNQSASITAEYGQQSNLYNQIDDATQLKRNASDEAKKQSLDDQKAQQEAAKRAVEAMKQAQELIVQQWRKDLDEKRAESELSLAQEAQYWLLLVAQANKGTKSYLAAVDENNKVIARIRAENGRNQQAFDRTASQSYLPVDLSREANFSGEGRDAAGYLRSLNEGITLRRQNTDALDEARLKMAETTGQVSRLDAAQQQATLHTREYEHAISDLRDALANVAGNTGLSPLERSRQTSDLNNELSQMQGQRNIQVLQDRQAIDGQSIGAAMQRSLGEMVNAWKDMAGQIASTLARTVSSFNDDLVKAITGQGKKGDFGRTAIQAGQALLKTGLQRAEGSILGAFGIGGKADGSSASNALWVRMASAASSVGGAAGGLGGLLGRFIQPFVGARAGGGDVLAGHAYLVGERGPEPFIPRSSGTILPNSMLGGGATANHTYNIDARGATDPAAIHAAVARALPHAVAASMQAQHQYNRRTPQSR